MCTGYPLRASGSTAVIMPDNAFIEAFNGRFRVECLNAHWFLSLADARDYNEERPHGAIGQKPG